MGVVLTKTDMLLTLVYRRWSIQMEGAPGDLRKSPENSLETFIKVMLHNIQKIMRFCYGAQWPNPLHRWKYIEYAIYINFNLQLYIPQ